MLDKFTYNYLSYALLNIHTLKNFIMHLLFDTYFKGLSTLYWYLLMHKMKSILWLSSFLIAKTGLPINLEFDSLYKKNFEKIKILINF